MQQLPHPKKTRKQTNKQTKRILLLEGWRIVNSTWLTSVELQRAADVTSAAELCSVSWSTWIKFSLSPRSLTALPLSSARTGNDLSASNQLLPIIRAGGDDSRSATKRFSFIPFFFFVISVIAAIKFGFRASKVRLCVWTDATRSRFVLICRQIFMEHMPDVAAVCHSTVTPRQAFKNTPFDLSFFFF